MFLLRVLFVFGCGQLDLSVLLYDCALVVYVIFAFTYYSLYYLTSLSVTYHYLKCNAVNNFDNAIGVCRLCEERLDKCFQ